MIGFFRVSSTREIREKLKVSDIEIVKFIKNEVFNMHYQTVTIALKYSKSIPITETCYMCCIFNRFTANMLINSLKFLTHCLKFEFRLFPSNFI